MEGSNQMIVSIHQPSYFPWFGLLDKIAKSELYVMMDEVQLSDRAYQHRNLFLKKDGKEKILTIGLHKKDYRDKRMCELSINRDVDWQKQHKCFIVENYRKSKYFEEIWERIQYIYEKEYHILTAILEDSMKVSFNMLDINIETIKQSELNYNRDMKKSDLILELCLATKADVYLSGQGAKEYMNIDDFRAKGIDVVFQKFSHPIYTQNKSYEFVSGLSILDCLFHNGINETRRIFWENVNKGEKYE